MHLTELDFDAVERRAAALLARTNGLPPRREVAGIRVSTAVSDDGWRLYRSDVEFPAPVDAVARLIADDMVERLGDWNREFVAGEVRRILPEGSSSGPSLGLPEGSSSSPEGSSSGSLSGLPEGSSSPRAWLVRVEYATPWPLANREYVYGLRRRDADDGSVWIVYQSVDDGSEVGVGCVRARLDATVHRVVPTGAGCCRLEHVLANDLGGAFPAWAQRHLLTGALLDANLRDASAQRALFGVS